MVYDDVRNSAYAAAIRRRVDAQTTVLDLGSGLGLHGLVAAAAGAKHVYLVDPSPVTLIAARIAVANGFDRRVTAIRKTIEKAELPEKVDLIVSVFTGNFLLGEDLLSSLFCARDRYLNPDGALLPDRAEMRVAPVSAPEYFDQHIACWDTDSQGIDFGPARSFAANTMYYDGAERRAAEFMAEPATLTSLDLTTADKAKCNASVSFIVPEAGTCHGFLGWFRMRLGDAWLSTSPARPAMHWSQAFLPLDPPLSLRAGDQLEFRLLRREGGEWTWTCVRGDSVQRHSTFLPSPVDPGRLRHTAEAHRPSLSEVGELAQFVIGQMNGVATVAAVREKAMEEFAGRLGSARELRAQIDAILKSCGK